MFLPILLSLGLIGASATSVGNGNCPTDAELLQPFTQTSESFDLAWFQNAQKECANGNCKDVARTIFSVADQTKNNFEDRFWFARFSLECRTEWSRFEGRCVDYNMPINEANDVISSYGGFDGLNASKQKLLKKRNELLYRVGWYKDPEFEGCNDNALLETPVEQPEDTANYGAGVSDDEGLDEDIAAADVSDDYDWDDWNDVDAPVEDTAPIVDEAPTEFLTIKVTAPTGIASYDNYLAGEGVLLVEGTTPVAEEAPESPVEEPTTIEAQYEAEEETEKQVNKPASKSRWKFWQRYAA